MPWDRESVEEYDDGYTRDSFERADEDTADDMDRSFGPLRAAAMRREDGMGAGFASARECAIDEQAALDRPEFDYDFDYVEGE